MSERLFGWQDSGEFHCPCGTQFGKNLNGVKPFLLVSEHIVNCVPHAVQRIKLGHPPKPRPSTASEETWDIALCEHAIFRYEFMDK